MPLLVQNRLLLLVPFLLGLLVTFYFLLTPDPFLQDSLPDLPSLEWATTPLSLTSLASSSSSFSAPSSPSQAEQLEPCNPYLLPGLLSLNHRQPPLSTYSTFHPTCKPNNTLLHLFSSPPTPSTHIPEFTNTSILILGDSVDRGQIMYLCLLAQLAHPSSSPFPAPTLRSSSLSSSLHPDPEEEENNGNPRTCSIPSRGMKIHFYHFCGFTHDGEMWKDKPNPCNSPSDFPSRWRLFQQWAKTLEREPELVVVQSSMWDIAAFDRSLYLTQPSSTDLEAFLPGWLDEWRKDMERMIRDVRGMFGEARVAYRLLHEVRDGGGRWFRPWGRYNTTHGAAFRPLRVEQLRQAQRAVVRAIQEEERAAGRGGRGGRGGVEMLPFGDVVRGWKGVLKDDIHPAQVGNAVLGEMILEALWREQRARGVGV